MGDVLEGKGQRDGKSGYVLESLDDVAPLRLVPGGFGKPKSISCRHSDGPLKIV